MVRVEMEKVRTWVAHIADYMTDAVASRPLSWGAFQWAIGSRRESSDLILSRLFSGRSLTGYHGWISPISKNAVSGGKICRRM